jgi:flavin-dependent dehydrogenase
VIAFRGGRRPGYAWSFDRGDGLANVGYGEILAGRHARSTRAEMLSRLEALLPGAARGAGHWRGAQLPLAGWRWRPPGGPVLLAGDAAGVVNPMTGEGIYDAVATGLAAGRAAAEAIGAGCPEQAGGRYRTAVRPVLARHQRHAAAAASLCRHGAVLEAGLRASAADQHVFDDLVQLGLARGTITARLVRGLARELVLPERAAATEETG